ncbi:hypothetical protein POTOM_000703 [Populus tomentosa]|uniref:Glutaredoxin domain-containing protein n=1 Tax=Populus tomentosa TaxID=118781 RepID=A0A8X8DGJ9_POPTO|nr:hypothetical protein POTOM_000703 [Populus tomentosa]
MGCNSSKRNEASEDVYLPPPSSFAVFDINSIQEPWPVVDNSVQENQEMPSIVQAPILEKLNQFETDAPHSWDEVSKALEDLKPTLSKKKPIATPPPPPSQKPYTTPTQVAKTNQEKKQEPRKSLRKVEVVSKPESRVGTEPVIESGTGGAVRSVKENIFIVRDKLEREKGGKPLKKLDPLSGFEEKSPPSGANSIVLYTTSLRGERDVSLHGEFLNELRDLTGEGVSVPKVFIKGRYIGGVDEVVELNESGRLGRMLVWARVERVEGRQAFEGCGDARSRDKGTLNEMIVIV